MGHEYGRTRVTERVTSDHVGSHVIIRSVGRLETAATKRASRNTVRKWGLKEHTECRQDSMRTARGMASLAGGLQDEDRAGQR